LHLLHDFLGAAAQDLVVLFGLFERRFWAVTIGDSPSKDIGKIMVKFMENLWRNYGNTMKHYQTTTAISGTIGQAWKTHPQKDV